jgi:hypothetical protein
MMPEKLGKYAVSGVIGRSAMGIVYEGYDESLGRRVALKTIAPAGLSGEDKGRMITRLRRAARAIGRLNHPNIITLYELVEESVPFMAMEFVEGSDLGAYQRAHGPLDLPSTGLIMRELLAALESAHSAGVIHGNIKPSNVLLQGKTGAVKLADFDAAQLSCATGTTAMTLARPCYMAPEQFRGEPPDARSDVYSAGVLLYQLLTGQAPLDGTPAEIANTASQEHLERPSVLNPQLPSDLDAVVLRAMAKRAVDRYPSAAAFSEGLAQTSLAAALDRARGTASMQDVPWPLTSPATVQAGATRHDGTEMTAGCEESPGRTSPVQEARLSATRGLAVLQDVIFDCVRRWRDVWHDDGAHAPGINTETFQAVLSALESAGQQLGRVWVGDAGQGKTRLLGALRAVVVRKGWFVLIDMTDVLDFWETVLQGYLDSLRQPLRDGRSQFQSLLHEVLGYLAERGTAPSDVDYEVTLRTAPLAEIANLAQRVISEGVAPLYPARAHEFQDVLRALLLLNAEDFDVSNLGFSWLLGLELSDAERRDCGFSGARRSAKHVVQGLSWLMSLTRPTLLALEEVDDIVREHAVASHAGEREDQAAARAVLHGIGNGLLGLHDALQRTLTVLSCFTGTWDMLRRQTAEVVPARFESNPLKQTADAGAGCRIVETRLAAAYEKHAFRPPYASWPFRPEAFEGAAGLRPPRSILVDCAAHRDRCLAAGVVQELQRFGPVEPSGSSAADAVAQRFARLLESVSTAGLGTDEAEDERLGKLIASACVCAVSERPVSDEQDLLPEVDFPGHRDTPALHARLRITEYGSGQVKRYCFRALNLINPVAFRNRLRLAMTASGISRDLSRRRLVIVRDSRLPEDEQTQTLLRSFHAAGGKLVSCSQDELKRLIVLDQLLRERPIGLDNWLLRERPASTLSFLKESGFVVDAEAAVVLPSLESHPRPSTA